MKCCGTCKHLKIIVFNKGTTAEYCVQICGLDDGEWVGDRASTDTCDKWEEKQ